MKLSTFVLNFILFLISIIIAIIILNFLILALNQKNFPNLHTKLFKEIISTYTSPDIRRGHEKKYLFIGDSYAIGAGDSFLNGDYNYSLAHYFANKKNIDVYNLAHGGFGNYTAAINALRISKYSSSSLFLSKFPKFSRGVIFFYEGNDLNNNLRDEKRFGKVNDFNDILKLGSPSLSRTIMNGYFFGLKFVYTNLKMRYNDFKIKSKSKTNEIVHFFPNTIKLSNIEIKSPPLQAAAVELSNEQIDKSLFIFKQTVIAINKYFNLSNNIDIIYIPSVSSCYEWDSKIYVATYETDEVGFLKINKEKNQKNSEYIRSNIQNFSKKYKYNFIDSTNYLREKCKDNLLHGPEDFNHFNKLGYEELLIFLDKEKKYFEHQQLLK